MVLPVALARPDREHQTATAAEKSLVAKNCYILVIAPCCASEKRTLTICMPAGEEEEEDDEEANAADLAFIDDEPVEQQANFRDMEDLPQQFYRTVGMQEEEEDPKEKNKERQEPRALLPSTERATYADLADEPGCENHMLFMPCIDSRAVPYTVLL